MPYQPVQAHQLHVGHEETHEHSGKDGNEAQHEVDHQGVAGPLQVVRRRVGGQQVSCDTGETDVEIYLNKKKVSDNGKLVDYKIKKGRHWLAFKYSNDIKELILTIIR